MKLWKRTVALMLITLLCSLIPVGVLSLYVTGKRSLNNAAETYGRQLANGKNLLEQFWDNSKYEQMSETGKKSYLEFQFLRCCGEKMLLINSESKEAVVNRTDYEIVSMDNLGLNNKTDSYEYKIQKLNHKYLLLQHALLTNPEGYEILSVRDGKTAGSSRKTGNAYGSTCPRNENTSYFYYWIFRHSAACKTKR